MPIVGTGLLSSFFVAIYVASSFSHQRHHVIFLQATLFTPTGNLSTETMKMMDESLASQSVFSDEDEDRSSPFSTGVTSQEDKQKDNSLILFKGQDTRQVVFWMMVVLGMIGVTAAIVLSSTYTFLAREEETQFRNGVSRHGRK